MFVMIACTMDDDDIKENRRCGVWCTGIRVSCVFLCVRCILLFIILYDHRITVFPII